MNSLEMNNRGIANIMLVVAVFMTIITVILAGLSIYFITKYNEAKTTVDQQRAEAAAAAREEQKQIDEAAFIERSKEPFRTYAAPAVLGALRITYPKTWNLYAQENSGSGNQLNLFWNPDLVQADGSYKGTYALRVTLDTTVYTQSVARRQAAIEQGELSAEPITISGINGTRYVGNVAENHTGVMVILPIRDKTLTLWTESTDYTNDFNIVVERLNVSP